MAQGEEHQDAGRQAVWTATQGFTECPILADHPGDLQATLQTVAATCKPNVNTAATWDQKGAAWAPDWCGVGGGYSHLLAPNKPACFFSNYNTAKFGPFPGNDDITMIGAQSNHSGGVNVGFLDGSVKFIKDSSASPGCDRHQAGGEPRFPAGVPVGVSRAVRPGMEKSGVSRHFIAAQRRSR